LRFSADVAATGGVDASKSVYNPPFIVFIFTSEIPAPP
jgi:hypothetical protein